MRKIFILSMVLISKGLFAQEVVELNLPKSNKIIVKLMFKNGSISDPTGKEGITALTSNLVVEGGTGNLSYSDIEDLIYPMAANYSGTVDKEVSVFTFEFPKDYAEKFYPILKGLILNPSFSKEDFGRVKDNQTNYIDQVIRNSSDEEYSKILLEEQLFKGTSYQHPVLGTSNGLASITLEDVKNHYKENFAQSNLTIGIAGSYSNDFLNKLKLDLKALPAKSPVFSAPKISMPDGVNVEIVGKENTLGSAIFAGFPIDVTRSNDDFAALMVANSFLGEHRKSYSRLYQKIRSARSMNYGDYTYIEWYPNGGQNMLPPSGYPRKANYFSIWLRPVQTAISLKKQYPELSEIKIGHAQFAIRLAIREIDSLVKKGMRPGDFELTKEFLKSYIKLYAQSPESELGYLLDSKFYGRKDYIKELGELLNKVTLDDVNKAVRKYLQVKDMDIAIVTDKSEAQPLSDALKSNDLSPMTYSNVVKESLPKEVLAEDAEIAKYPLNIKSVKIIDNKDPFKK